MSSDGKLAKLSAELISARADALLFSGGGDDLFVQGGYSPASTASAFEWFLKPAGAGCLDQKRFDRSLGDLYTAIQRIADVATQCDLPCFLHTYAVPIPSGRAALSPSRVRTLDPAGSDKTRLRSGQRRTSHPCYHFGAILRITSRCP